MVVTVKNERLCPGVITDEVHLPSAAVPFSVPVLIYVKESGTGIFKSSGDGIVRCGRAADRDARVETVEIQIHEALRGHTKLTGTLRLVKVWRGRSRPKTVRESGNFSQETGESRFLGRAEDSNSGRDQGCLARGLERFLCLTRYQLLAWFLT